jgi:hypothetical protein
MPTQVPADWFMGTEHEFFRIAWLLYDNEEQLDPIFVDRLVQLLKQLETDTIITPEDFVHRVKPADFTKKQQQKKDKIMDDLLKEAQDAERERRKKKAEKEPLLAAMEKEKPIPTSIYDYYDPVRLELLIQKKMGLSDGIKSKPTPTVKSNKPKAMKKTKPKTPKKKPDEKEVKKQTKVKAKKPKKQKA